MDDGDHLKRLVYERDNQIESLNVIIDKLESELHLCRRSTDRVVKLIEITSWITKSKLKLNSTET